MFRKPPKDIPTRRQDVSTRGGGGESLESPFVRNRTITGSLLSQVKSTTEMTGHLRSPRVEAHALTQHRRRLSGILVIALSVSGFLALIISQFTASVETTMAGDGSRQLPTSYAQTIDEYLAGRPIERLRPFLNEEQLTAYLGRSHAEVESVRLEGGSGFATSSFTLLMRRPLASWSLGDEQKYVDGSGESFTVNYYESPSLQVIDNTFASGTASAQVLTSDRFLSFTGQLLAACKTYKLSVDKVIIPERTTRQLEVVMQGSPITIRVSTDRGAEEQAEDISRALSYFTVRGQTPQYIDVRVSGKAYYQ